MKFRDLQIQTQREAPNNARIEGFAFLVRAGFLTRENVPTKLGEYAIEHLRSVAEKALPAVPTIESGKDTFFPIAYGDVEIIHCPSCKYTERLEIARFAKPETHHVPPLPLEKMATLDCNTIESLANFLGTPKEKTAKALMYTRTGDQKFIFVVVRGDMQLSEAKLKAIVGEVRAATVDEIVAAGAAPGYASAIGLREALIVVDDLIPQSPNLVAGANEDGFHLLNTNYGRDYSAGILTDLIQAKEGDACAECGTPLTVLSAISLKKNDEYEIENILLALAEAHHDEKGLTIPHPAAPFDVYLMNLPGKEIDTRARVETMYRALQAGNIPVLFDDRDERAGVKFNDADLIGCPIRVTAGEKALKEGMMEFKPRNEKENQPVPVEALADKIKSFLQQSGAG